MLNKACSGAVVPELGLILLLISALLRPNWGFRYDEERLSVGQYASLLSNITSHLVAVQRQHGTKLLWVKTTPVPTVPAYGAGCNGSATVCLNPVRHFPGRFSPF